MRNEWKWAYRNMSGARALIIIVVSFCFSSYKHIRWLCMRVQFLRLMQNLCERKCYIYGSLKSISVWHTEINRYQIFEMSVCVRASECLWRIACSGTKTTKSEKERETMPPKVTYKISGSTLKTIINHFRNALKPNYRFGFCKNSF